MGGNEPREFRKLGEIEGTRKRERERKFRVFCSFESNFPIVHTLVLSIKTSNYFKQKQEEVSLVSIFIYSYA